MILELLVLASLLRTDPVGDAYGAGDLVPPSAELYADLSSFDLTHVEVVEAEFLTVHVGLAGIPDPGGLPNGITLPVIDVYLDLAEGGEELTLPGVGMALPAGRGWEIAIRVHGDAAVARRSDDPDGAPLPVRVRREDDRLVLETSLPAPDEVRDVQAVTGVYDPFSVDAWRPLSVTPSPWAFSSATPAPPVVDVLAEDDAAQRQALQAYVLPVHRASTPPIGWLSLMIGGVSLAAVGLWLRRRVPPPSSTETPEEGAEAAPEAAPDVADEGPPPAANAGPETGGGSAVPPIGRASRGMPAPPPPPAPEVEPLGDDDLRAFSLHAEDDAESNSREGGDAGNEDDLSPPTDGAAGATDDEALSPTAGESAADGTNKTDRRSG